VSARDPTPLVRLSTAYWDSQVFLTANRLRLFDQLAAGPRSSSQIAAQLGLEARPARLFLNACVALGLLELSGEGYGNSAVSQAFLVRGSPAFMGNAVLYSDQLYETWGKLEQGLRQREPVLPAQSYLGADPERTRAFVHGMHDRANGIARSLVGLLDLTDRRRMLDVGGGPGTYSLLLARQYPALRSVVLELEGVARIGREMLAGSEAGERVEFVTGDYHTSDFPAGCDVVLMSGMFHRESAPDCRRLIGKAAECLTPGGLLVVSDVFTDRGGASPPFAALFGLNMMLTAPSGGVHADADVADWLREAGFTRIETKPFPPPMPHRVVIGARQ
jgi:3-hydroxy-5-methyl-1-naphthoate 3-O-methyltransferase